MANGESSTPLHGGSSIWSETDPTKIAAVVAEYDKLIVALEKKSRLSGVEYKMSDAKMSQIEKLRNLYIKLRKEQDAVGKSISGLVTKMQGSGGITGAFTRFAGALPGLFSKVNEGTGTMRIFGAQTDLTAGKFMTYVGVFQLAVGAIVKYLDAQDKARIKQAELIRSFGALSNISVAQPFEVAAKGIEIAGESGKEAAEKLQTALIKMRIPAGQVGNLSEQPAFAQVTRLTTGGLPKTPEYLTRLRAVFSKRDINELSQTIMEVGAMAHASGVPIEQLVDQVFSLGEEFAAVGIKIDDVNILMSKFGDAIGKAELPMQMVVDFARATMQELQTGKGVEGLVKVAVFASNGFDNLSKSVQDMLNNAARAATGKEFQSMGVLEQAAVFKEMGKGDYGVVRLEALYDIVSQLKKSAGGIEGDIIAQIAAPAITGHELVVLEDIMAKRKSIAAGQLEPGAAKTAEEIGEDYEAVKGLDLLNRQAILASKGTTAAFDSFTDAVSESLREFTAEFTAEWSRLKGAFFAFTSETTNQLRMANAIQRAESRQAHAILGAHASEFVGLSDQQIFSRMKQLLSPSLIQSFLQESFHKWYKDQPEGIYDYTEAEMLNPIERMLGNTPKYSSSMSLGEMGEFLNARKGDVLLGEGVQYDMPIPTSSGMQTLRWTLTGELMSGAADLQTQNIGVSGDAARTGGN